MHKLNDFIHRILYFHYKNYYYICNIIKTERKYIYIYMYVYVIIVYIITVTY